MRQNLSQDDSHSRFSLGDILEHKVSRERVVVVGFPLYGKMTKKVIPVFFGLFKTKKSVWENLVCPGAILVSSSIKTTYVKYDDHPVFGESYERIDRYTIAEDAEFVLSE